MLAGVGCNILDDALSRLVDSLEGKQRKGGDKRDKRRMKIESNDGERRKFGGKIIDLQKKRKGVQNSGLGHVKPARISELCVDG